MKLIAAAAFAGVFFVSTAVLGQSQDHDPSELECIFYGVSHEFWDEVGRSVAGLPVDPEAMSQVNAQWVEAAKECHADFEWSDQELMAANEYAQINSVVMWLSGEITSTGVANFKGLYDALEAMTQDDRQRLVGGGLNTDPAFKADMEARARLAGVPEAGLEATINYFASSIRVEQLKAAWVTEF